MVGFSPVAPPEYLHLLKREGLLGNYHLLLAHDVAARPHLYEGLFTEDDFIIMDNSLIELGIPVNSSVMSAACKVVPVTCAVLPDYMKNKVRTLESAREALVEWTRRGIDKLVSDGFMAVPQGSTPSEILECSEDLAIMAMDYPINYWGVGKYIGETFGSRRAFVQELTKNSKALVHLLGFTNHLADDVTCSQIDGVIGIDSAVPVRLGNVGIRILTKNYIDSSRRPKDYWERCASWQVVNDNVRHNINFVREAFENAS